MASPQVFGSLMVMSGDGASLLCEKYNLQPRSEDGNVKRGTKATFAVVALKSIETICYSIIVDGSIRNF